MAKKHINAEKLIHDLEERIFAYSEGYAAGDDCRKDAIETLLKDVKYQLSLQQEQPEVNLEKEVSKWWDASFPEPDFKFRKHRAHIVSNDEIINLARHFYELGRNSK